jgi:hypothetical protein
MLTKSRWLVSLIGILLVAAALAATGPGNHVIAKTANSGYHNPTQVTLRPFGWSMNPHEPAGGTYLPGE